jgi:flagellar basal body L-ring protein FlgH
VVGVVTANAQSVDPLAELRIQISSGQDLHLFTDHRAGQIDDLVTAVNRVRAGEA